MSIDIMLSPGADYERFNKERLLEEISGKYELVKYREDEDGYVTDLSILPKDPSQREAGVAFYDFCIQPDGNWWHPVPTRTDAGFELDQNVTDWFCDTFHCDYILEM